MLAPALIDTIKSAGLVLVSDISGSSAETASGPRSKAVSEKVDGTIRGNGVLMFTDNLDITGF
jgi:hypothetical protein